MGIRTLALSALAGLPLIAGDPAPPYRDPAQPVEARIADLLARMTLEEKVAQLEGVWSTKPLKSSKEGGAFDPARAAEVYKHGVGSIGRQNEHNDARASAAYANDTQRWLRGHTRLGIPAFFHDEVLHGHMAKGGTHYPQPLAMACSWNPDLISQVFTAAALEVRARGSHHVLGPNLDLGREPRWGRIGETYGEDAFLATAMSLSAIQALQGDGGFRDKGHVMATLKHFAAHGQPSGGTNVAPPAECSERLLRDVLLRPFETAVKSGHAWSVMPSYNEIDGVPSHANKRLLNGVLRQEWGFDGFIASDYEAVRQLEGRHHVAANGAEAARFALEAGVDMELPDPDCYREIPALLSQGKLPLATVDRAVSRVLRAKFTMGLFDDPYVDPEKAALVTNGPKQQALALEAARESIVLLKNQNGLLPLDASKLKRLAVIGPNAAKVHLGGYSDDPMRGISLLQGIQERLKGRAQVEYAEGCRITEEGGNWVADKSTLPDPREEDRRIGEAVAVAKRSDAVVLVIGGNEDIDKESWADDHIGDRDNLDLFGRQMDLARALLATGKPVVVFLIVHGPLAIPELAEKAPAILSGFYLGQEGGTAAAEILFGDVNPSGKLAVTFPRGVGQLPAYYNRKPTAKRGYVHSSTEPVFPFGHGLSYTTFTYSDIQVQPSRIKAGRGATVTFTVRNTGLRAGDEIAQLYLRDDVSSVTRPIQELAGFQRVSLKPGEKTTVSLRLAPESLAFTGLDMKRIIEPGTFTLMVGPSSTKHQDVKLVVE